MKPEIVRRAAAAATALLLAAVPATAQKVGTSSLQFLKVMPAARATAMGDAFVSLATGAEAAFWNPAGITTTASHDIATTVTLWLFDTRQSAIAYALPVEGVGTFAAQLQFVDYGDFTETRVDQLQFVGSGGDVRYNPGLTGATFSPSALVVGLSYARDLTDRFTAGVTVKYVSESLYGADEVTVVNSSGASETYKTYARLFLFDFGMKYNTGFHSVRLGASVANFGSQVKFGSEEYPAPLTFRLGIAGDIMGNDALLWDDDRNRVTVSYDIHQPNDYAQQMHFGAEYAFADLFALRGGYKANYDADGFTFGAGFQTGLAGAILRFDYSYGAMGEYLPSVHRLSLGVNIP